MIWRSGVERDDKVSRVAAVGAVRDGVIYLRLRPRELQLMAAWPDML